MIKLYTGNDKQEDVWDLIKSKYDAQVYNMTGKWPEDENHARVL